MRLQLDCFSEKICILFSHFFIIRTLTGISAPIEVSANNQKAGLGSSQSALPKLDYAGTKEDYRQSVKAASLARYSQVSARSENH